MRGGREEARLRLRQFWEAIGRMPGFAGLLGSLSGEFQAQMRLEQTPAYHGEAIGARTTFDFKKLLPDDHLGGCVNVSIIRHEPFYIVHRL